MVWGKKQRGDPAYVQKRKNAEQSRREREHHQQNIAAINAIADQLARSQNEERTEDSNRAFREKVTICLLSFTFVAAFVGDGIFYITLDHADENFIRDQRPIIWNVLSNELPKEMPPSIPQFINGNKIRWNVYYKNFGKGTAYNVACNLRNKSWVQR